RNALQFQSDLKFGVASGNFKYAVGGPLDDLGPRIVVLVNAVPKAHQLAFTFLDLLDVGGHVVLGTNLIEHVQHFFVCPAVQRAGESRSRRSRGQIGVGLGTAHSSHGVRAAVLLMVRMQ